MLKLHDIMSRDVVTVSPELSIRGAAELFAEHHISGAPVIQQGRLVGIITAADILDFIGSLPAEPPEIGDNGEWNAFEAHTVQEAMTRPPLHTLPPDASVDAAASLLQQTKTHRVLVMTGDELVGLVSAVDITRAFAEHKLATRTWVFGHPRPVKLRR